MNIYLQLLIETTIIFVGIFLFNYYFFVRKNKKLKKDEMPLELIYLSGIYGINPQNINFRKFQYAYCLINSFIITTTYVIVTYLIQFMLLKVIVGIVVLVLLIIFCYGLLGRYYMYKEIKMEEEKKQQKKKKKSKK